MNKLSVPSKCIVFRNGIEIWIPEGEKLDKLQNILGNLQAHMFINWEGTSMNTADITGVFAPSTMEDMKRRKNGDWLCAKGEWHQKFTECACRAEPESRIETVEISEEERERNLAALEEIKKKFLN